MHKLKIKCGVCKKKFFCYKSDNRKFCSRKCFLLSRIGKPSWNKGLIGYNKKYPRNKEWCQNISKSKMKDDNKVGYRALHEWVEKHLGKASKCSNNINHKSSRYHWANISGEYKRDLSDWHELCPSCNMNDGIKKNKRFLRR